MKRLLWLFFFCALLVLMFLGLWRFTGFAVSSQDPKSRDFLITKGQSVQAVAKNLKREDLIRSELGFRLYMRASQKTIQAGRYQLAPNMSLSQIVLTLTSGPKEIWITYPEGVRREEIVARTVKSLEMDPDSARTFGKDFEKESQGLEGFLFPDTYLFPRDVAAKNVVARLKSTFDAKTGSMAQDIAKSGMKLNGVVILASIVERETLTDEERPVVAGILLKRIDAGWPLQTDAAIQYFIGSKRCGQTAVGVDCDWWTPPIPSDKEIKSAFNTYLHKGLPPAPISNPGLSSIKAVVYPKESEYWFYLHGADGKIHYAKTIDEHNENIRKYL